ncbi:hypothetical protein MUK42_19000 [Musa troglodytarum]|uniref:Transmembrane protein n=1 Tax=Musa troglodytarum TaxID=320322 RepID=A0A9E7FRU2_9LILI|nr:hypothetical protein MUK42_19000 [Musa troglodytarum]
MVPTHRAGSRRTKARGIWVTMSGCNRNRNPTPFPSHSLSSLVLAATNPKYPKMLASRSTKPGDITRRKGMDRSINVLGTCSLFSTVIVLYVLLCMQW